MKPIVLCGPTASGKTELALALARATGGIIISADSRQVYTRLTIGTAKPQGQWENGQYLVEGVPYYLVDFLPVTEVFNAGNFCERVRNIVAHFPNQPVIFAGGTGMYLHAYFVGMDDLPASTPALRARLNTLLAQAGKEGLHQALAQKDPVSAAQIPMGNVQRTMRALELCLLTGKPANTLKTGKFFALPPQANSHWVYLDWAKEALQNRIVQRSNNMFEGMCAETQTLLAQGFCAQTAALKSLGYAQVIAFLEGRQTRQQALDELILKTRQYAKRQRTWFNRYTNAQRICLTTPADFDLQKITQAVLACVK